MKNFVLSAGVVTVVMSFLLMLVAGNPNNSFLPPFVLGVLCCCLFPAALLVVKCGVEFATRKKTNPNEVGLTTVLLVGVMAGVFPFLFLPVEINENDHNFIYVLELVVLVSLIFIVWVIREHPQIRLFGVLLVCVLEALSIIAPALLLSILGWEVSVLMIVLSGAAFGALYIVLPEKRDAEPQGGIQ